MISQEILHADLLTMAPEDFFLKYIVKSKNWYFSDYLKVPPDEIVDQMDYFKEVVSKNMGISFHSSQIVGSAKTGFSLSPKKPLKPFHDADGSAKTSDIDVAIVSSKLYEELWALLRKINGHRYYTNYYQQLASSVFRGYINDGSLKKFDSVREKWLERISPINMALQDNLRFVHPITYRIYRSWEDLEEYQLLGINKVRAKLEGARNV